VRRHRFKLRIHFMSVMHSCRTATVRIVKHLFVAEVGVVMTIAALGREASMTDISVFWDSRSTW